VLFNLYSLGFDRCIPWLYWICIPLYLICIPLFLGRKFGELSGRAADRHVPASSACCAANQRMSMVGWTMVDWRGRRCTYTSTPLSLRQSTVMTLISQPYIATGVSLSGVPRPSFLSSTSSGGCCCCCNLNSGCDPREREAIDPVVTIETTPSWMVFVESVTNCATWRSWTPKEEVWRCSFRGFWTRCDA